MEESTSIRLVSQFLHDHGFQNTLEALQKERCFADVFVHALIFPCTKCKNRYVVRVLWSPSGEFFLTASYDKTVCVYR